MPNQTCEFCGIQFSAPRQRRCCNQSCSAKLRLAGANAGAVPWTEAELDYLRERIGAFPAESIEKAYHRHAATVGFTARSAKAVQIKIRQLCRREGLSVKCTLNNWLRRELAQTLDIHPHRVMGWCKYGGLEVRRSPKNRIIICRKALKAWMQIRPEMVCDIDEDRLLYVLEDPDIVEAIKRASPSRRGHPKPVRCLTTGKTYPSATAAAKVSYYSRASIVRAANKQRGWAYAGDQ
jgi:hypothetical protein